jgi:hypothetical protein
LSDLGQIGAALLIAYAIATSWLMRASRSRPIDERENRLGALVGVGGGGLFGIILALALSERANVDHWIWLDQAAFGWVAASLVCLGVMVVLQPLVVHDWIDEEHRDYDAGD